MGKKKIDRDIALKVLAAVEAVKDALADLMETMFIIYQPKDFYGNVGDTATFSVVAMNVAAYQWQYSENDGVTWKNSGTSIPKTATISYEITEATYNNLRRCRLTDAGGNQIYTEVVRVRQPE